MNKLTGESAMLKISIITVSYNAAVTIEQTILSVIRQDYPNIEYIIIDGGSTDGTIDIIRKYEDKIAYWVSEPDQGIYDAMNKGIRRATGDYLYFLGADDWLKDEKVLCRVREFIRLHSGYGFYMGNVFLYHPKLRMEKRQRVFFSTEAVKKGHMYPHQGMFTQRELLQAGFDTKYKIAADYKFLLQNVSRGRSFCVMDIDVAYYSLFGTSAGIELNDEYIEIIKECVGEAYLGRMHRLQKTAALRSWVKRGLIGLLGEKRFLGFRGWQAFHGSAKGT